MDQLGTTASWDPDPLHEARTSVQGATDEPGSGRPPYAEVVLPLAALLALCGVLGNGVVAWLLCLHVRGSPYTTYFLHLAAADSLGLGCSAFVLLEKTLQPRSPGASHAAAVLEAVAGFSDTAGLCLLAALSTESLLGAHVPSWHRRRPRRTAAAVSALSWALALGVHAGTEVCAHLETGAVCDWLEDGLEAFHLLLGLVTCVSSLTVAFRRPQQCSPARIYLVLRTAIVIVFLWALPFAVIMHLPQQGSLSLATDVLSLLSGVAVTAAPVLYFLALCLCRRGRPGPLPTLLRRALLRDMET